MDWIWPYSVMSGSDLRFVLSRPSWSSRRWPCRIRKKKEEEPVGVRFLGWAWVIPVIWGESWVSMVGLELGIYFYCLSDNFIYGKLESFSSV